MNNMNNFLFILEGNDNVANTFHIANGIPKQDTTDRLFCAIECSFVGNCKGFKLNTTCRLYNDDLPYNGGMLDDDNAWVKGKTICIYIHIFIFP